MAKRTDLMVLVLTGKVSFVTNGVSEAELKAALRGVVDRAYKNGTLTGETSAEVEAVHVSVRNRKEGKPARAGGLRVGESVRLEDGPEAGRVLKVMQVVLEQPARVQVTFFGGCRRVYYTHVEVLVV